MRTRTQKAKVARGLVVCAMACGLGGCMQRSLDITSEPSGATVYLNDVEVGRTPVEVGFTYYGEYDVLLVKDGYEPLRTRADAVAPIYEHPPLDLAAEAMPWGVKTRVPWHFVMTPLPTTPDEKAAAEAALLERARATREKLEK